MNKFYMIGKLLIFFLSFFLNIHAIEIEGPAELLPTTESPTMVAGLVDVISGQISFYIPQIETDNLAPCRYGWNYSSSRTDKHWALDTVGHSFIDSDFSFVSLFKNSGKYIAGFAYGGNLIFLEGKETEDRITYTPCKTLLDAGYVNISNGVISGQNNLKNIVFEKIKKKYSANQFILTQPDGTKLYFSHETGLLSKKRFPNGNKLFYTYHKGIDRVKKIRATNANETKTFYTIDADIFGDSNLPCEVTSSRGDKAQYFPKRFTITSGKKTTERTLLTGIHHKYKPDIKFNAYSGYDDLSFLKLMSISSSSNNIIGIKWNSAGKVRCLTKPVGKLKEDIKVYKFFHYDQKDSSRFRKVKKGWTEVYDGLGNKTIYAYSINGDERKPIYTEYFDNDKTLQKKVSFFWGERGGANDNNLICRMQYAKDTSLGEIFKYDNKGNVVKHSIIGRLKDKHSKCNFSLKRQISDLNENNVENLLIGDQYCRYFSYSNDEFNLLTRVWDDYGLDRRFSYWKDTNLIKTTSVYDDDRLIQEQKFYYNEDAVLVLLEKISLFYHLITEFDIESDPNRDGFGKPIRKSEYYKDKNGVRQLIKESIYEYGQGDLLIAESLSDEKKNHIYTIRFSYDDRGRLIEKSDASGIITKYSYDTNFNISTDSVVGSGLKKQYIYDQANRLIELQLHNQEGEKLCENYFYDVMDNLLLKTDFYDNKYFQKVENSGCIVTQELPEITTNYGSLSKNVVEKTINGFGHLIKEKNNETVKSYINSSRGKPFLILPTGNAVEDFEYRYDGKLIAHHIEEGPSYYFEYDNFGNIIEKRTDNLSLGYSFSEYWYYIGDILVTYTDRFGKITKYKYDNAGRVIEEFTQGAEQWKKTTYNYDNLGRKYKVMNWLDEETYVSSETIFDKMNRMKEKKEIDSNGVTYNHTKVSYDFAGREVLKERKLEDGIWISEEWKYNSFGELVSYKDTNDEVTQFDYNHKYRNKKGEKILLKSTTLPNGCIINHEINSYGKIENEEKYDIDGMILQKNRFYYDYHGNKIEELHDVYVKGKKIKEYKISRKYDLAGRMIVEIENPDSSNRKKTTYQYDSCGRLTTIVKPDLQTIELITSTEGKILSKQSSDESILQEWHYNIADLPVVVYDNNLPTIRGYDEFGRMTSEILNNGLKLTYQYDRLDRVIKIELPEGGYISYLYDTINLTEVRRCNKEGKILFVHKYDKYNYLGRPVEQTLIGGGGKLFTSYDKNFRIKSLEHPLFFQSDFNFDVMGNLIGLKTSDPFGETNINFRYDNSDQLIYESGFNEHKFKYDSIHNRLYKDGNSYIVGQDNEIEDNGLFEYSYDANGNLTKKSNNQETTLFSYDALNRLTQITYENHFSNVQRDKTFIYDAFNRRVVDESKGKGKVNYLFENNYEVGSYDSNQIPIDKKILGYRICEDLSAAIAIEVKNEIYIPMHSYKGDICCLLDFEGRIVNAWRYSAFQEENRLKEKIISPWRFSGRRIEKITGFVIFNHRFYDPEIGCWITKDPSGYNDGINLYSYVSNNPLIKFDPNGLAENLFCGFKAFCKITFPHILWKDERLKYRYDFENHVELYDGPSKLFDLKSNMDKVSRSEYQPHLKEFDNGAILCCNGIRTRFSSSVNTTHYISELTGGYNVYGVYNAHHNCKIMECGLLWLGYITTPTKVMLDSWDYLFDRMNSNGKILHIYFSQSGFHTVNAKKIYAKENSERLSRIMFVGIAGANIVDKKGTGGSVFYTSLDDFVYAFNISRILERSDYVHLLPSKSDKFLDHEVESSTVKEIIKHEIKVFKESLNK